LAGQPGDHGHPALGSGELRIGPTAPDAGLDLAARLVDGFGGTCGDGFVGGLVWAWSGLLRDRLDCVGVTLPFHGNFTATPLHECYTDMQCQQKVIYGESP
jgi:hypothetical protein